jgi:TonB family protein
VICTALGVCLTTPALRAQQGGVGTGGIAGSVKDSIGTAIVGAEISLAGSTLRVETDERGEFRLGNVPAGLMLVRVRRIGFHPDTSELMVIAGRSIPLDIVLGRLAVELRPVVINGRQGLTGWAAGFYGRKDRGMGHFITGDDIERRNPMNMTDLFRMVPGTRIESRGFARNAVRFRGARCPPLVWLDGTPLTAGEFDLDALPPQSLAGVEIYSGPASVPAEFLGTQSISSSCGTVILWSKEGELRAKRRKKGAPSAASEIAELVAANRVFTAQQVDSPASLDPSQRIIPLYPDQLFEQSIPGTVLAEFVVTHSGEVNLDTYNAVMSTHPSFAESVRRALRSARFTPATKAGQIVQQVVQQPFHFVPDSTKRRR